MGKTKYLMAPIIDAITETMTCELCPFQCKVPHLASKATCVNRWHEILSNMKMDSRVNVTDYILDKAGRNYNG